MRGRRKGDYRGRCADCGAAPNALHKYTHTPACRLASYTRKLVAFRAEGMQEHVAECEKQIAAARAELGECP